MPSAKRRITITPADEDYALSCAAAFSRSPSLRNYASVSGVLRYALRLMRGARAPAAWQLAPLSRIARRLRAGTIDAKTAAVFIERALADMQCLTDLTGPARPSSVAAESDSSRRGNQALPPITGAGMIGSDSLPVEGPADRNQSLSAARRNLP